jgi:hypothetical protein
MAFDRVQNDQISVTIYEMPFAAIFTFLDLAPVWHVFGTSEQRNSMRHFGLATQPHDFPCPSLFVPIIKHGDFAE